MLLVVFGIVLLVGIGFRTYRFHDFLRFNADQSRDATLASEVLAGTAPWPALGPKAGGTEFRLGSIFYSFQIVSAKLFGDTPDAMAYPDLLTSFLAIPLLFFLLRKYFNTKTSLGLAAVFALSYYAVKYSRFAWNPNSTPFWSLLFLYALHETVAPGRRKRPLFWAGVLGMAIGVGVELHTLLLALLPTTTVIVFGYALWQQRDSRLRLWKSLAIVVTFALLINMPQIVTEYQTSGTNIKAFLSGASNKQQKGKGIAVNLSKDALCLSQGNVYMLTGYDTSDTCDTKSIDKVSGALATGVGFIFLVGGALLLTLAVRREENQQRKYFLGIALVYLSGLWVMLVPLAQEVSMRFYLIVPIMPFLLLGLWSSYIQERLGRFGGERVWVVVIGLLCLSNVYVSVTTLRDIGNYMEPMSSVRDFEFITQGEAEQAADWIVANTSGHEAILDGNALITFKGGKSIGYFTKRQGVTLSQKTKNVASGTSMFTIDRTTRKPEMTVYGRPTEKTYVIGRLMLSMSRMP